MHHRILFAIGLLLAHAAPCHAQTAGAPTTSVRDNDARQTLVLKEGATLLKAQHPAEAIQHYFDKVIASYEATYPAGARAVYCARSATESLFYLTKSAADKKEAVVFGPAWCDAYYLKAYALIDLGRIAEARDLLDKAIGMAPKNAHYLAERASLDRRETKWKEALAEYENAVQIADEFGPPESKFVELGEALRGKGYVLVELGRLDEAEAVYKQCLQINPSDKSAQGELGYVQARIKQKQS